MPISLSTELELIKELKRHGAWHVSPSTNFIGKHIGGCIYVHVDYVEVLPYSLYHNALGILMCFVPEFEWTIVKYNKKTSAFTFIKCDNFDTASEPEKGEAWIVRVDGVIGYQDKVRDPMIYHHKWQFVGRDYTGFNYIKSQFRSLEWTSLDGVNRSKIGKQSYWNQYVVPRLERGI